MGRPSLIVNSRDNIIPNLIGNLSAFTRARFGFTLIELLVVVLIIGVLASVALPQYRRATWKSRNAQLKTLAASMAQAQKTYLMANGRYAGNFSELDLDLPLVAPSMGTRQTDDICSMFIAGSDSVRRGTDFQVIINTNDVNSSGNIFAMWTTGPYKCCGFLWKPSTDERYCIEPHLLNMSGKFCKPVEGLSNYTHGTYFETYPLN